MDENSVYFQLHGTFMLLAWLLFASTGTIVARYFKQTWVIWRCYKFDVWFTIHVICMGIVWILTLIAVIFIIVGLGSFSLTLHALFGWIVVAVTLVTPFAAYFRPEKGTPNRNCFDIYHLISGITIHALAVAAIFLAIRLTRAQLPFWFTWGITGFVVFHVTSHLTFSILDYLGNKKAEERGKLNDQVYSRYRKGYLAVYVSMILMYTVYSITAIWRHV